MSRLGERITQYGDPEDTVWLGFFMLNIAQSIAVGLEKYPTGFAQFPALQLRQQRPSEIRIGPVEEKDVAKAG